MKDHIVGRLTRARPAGTRVIGSIPKGERKAHKHSRFATSAKCTGNHDLFLLVLCIYTINPRAHCIALKFISCICGQSTKLERSSHDKGRGTYDLIILSSLHSSYPNTNKNNQENKEIISNFDM